MTRFEGRGAMALGIALATATLAQASQQPATVKADLAPLSRPDVSTWPTIGSTMRTDPAKPTIPAQLRQVQMEPGAYRRFVASRKFDDGAAFAVLFYSVALDTSHAPPFYHSGKEVAFAMEVIDRSHADGRRFYLFAPGAKQAAALPAGNECAICHRTRGTFDGTFAHLYPLISSRVAVAAG